MSKRVMGVVLFVILSVGFQSGGSDQQAVEISLTDGVKFTGEIISLRDSSVLVAREVGLSYTSLATVKQTLMVLPFARINSIRVVSTHPLAGLFIGTAIGCAGGCAIGNAAPVEQHKDDVLGCEAQSERTDHTIVGAGAGGLAGAVVGSLIGSAVTTVDADLISPTKRDFQILKNVARYPGEEPSFLKSVGR
jgi:UDP-N-acetylglucosamine enolpyruvyl transferase